MKGRREIVGSRVRMVARLMLISLTAVPGTAGSGDLAGILRDPFEPAPEPATPVQAEAARRLERALEVPEVQAGLDLIGASRDDTARFLAEIGAIVSPSGQEHARAAAVADRMREIGLRDVRVTRSPNAVGEVPGRSGRALVFVSTLDDLATVAEHQRAAPVPPRVEGDRVVGPGTNTSSTSAAMLAAAQAVVTAGLEPRLSDTGSSNMNVAVGNGTLAIGLGGGRGGGRATPDEYADVPAMMRTARHVFLLAALVGGAVD